MNRETWLINAIDELKSIFQDNGYEIPSNLRVATGWPKGNKKKGADAIGQCFDPQLSSDKTTEIFISPTIDDANLVLSTLVHELVHAAVGCKHKHGKVFKRAALAVGLEGKMTSTTAGEKLSERLNIIANKIGPYPHKSIKNYQLKNNKKQTTPKIICDSCGYTLRTTKQWLDHALPECTECDKQMELESQD